MNEQIQAYIDACFAELREYIDMRLDNLQNATLSNIQEVLTIVPQIVMDTLRGPVPVEYEVRDESTNENNIQTNE